MTQEHIETSTVIVRDLGLQAYEPVWQKMQAFTETRDQQTRDEIWLLEHNKVFTQGRAGKAEHLLSTGDIPVIPVDRGGQVTYHGPGQLVGYLMIDLKRLGTSIRELVTNIEQAIIATLAEYRITANTRQGAPGVYVDPAKIASIGMRVSRGCTFHGLSLNIDMDMEPFLRINPCGYQGMQVTQMKQLAGQVSIAEVSPRLTEHLIKRLGYRDVIHESGWSKSS